MNRLFDATTRLTRLAVPLFALCVGASSLSAQTVQITSPANGTLFNPGQTIPVTVSADPSAFQSVAVAAKWPIGLSQVLTAPPYQFQMQIPSVIDPGAYSLTAVAVTPAGVAIGSMPITVVIERPDTPQQLNPDLSTLSFDYIGDYVALVVYGTFSDGSSVDLTRSTLTTWASDNTSVATVDTQGVVTAVAGGSANITITNAGVSVQIPVTVPQPIGIFPASMSLYPFQTQQFYAQLILPAGFTDNSVTWSVSPVLGSVDSTGLYTPPSSVDSGEERGGTA
jgi:hypothetical protein